MSKVEHCARCGSRVFPNTSFCTVCGTPIQTQPVVATSTKTNPWFWVITTMMIVLAFVGGSLVTPGRVTTTTRTYVSTSITTSLVSSNITLTTIQTYMSTSTVTRFIPTNTTQVAPRTQASIAHTQSHGDASAPTEHRNERTELTMLSESHDFAALSVPCSSSEHTLPRK